MRISAMFSTKDVVLRTRIEALDELRKLGRVEYYQYCEMIVVRWEVDETDVDACWQFVDDYNKLHRRMQRNYGIDVPIQPPLLRGTS